MATAEATTTINRPIDEVFAALTNPENNPKWQSSTIEARQVSAGGLGVGTETYFATQFLGRRIETTSVVTEFEQNRRFAWESKSGPFPLRGSMSLDPVDGGTRVVFVLDADPGGFFKVAEPLIVGAAKRQFQTDLANLKELMEAGAL